MPADTGIDRRLGVCLGASEEGEENGGPHIMIVGADPSFYDTYPKGADPDTSAPYVMWAGTPYQHLMAPVK